MKVKSISLFKFALAAALLVTSVSVVMADSRNSSGGDLLAVAKNQGHFTTLAKALEAAGLNDALTGKGPVTIFAPTDEAFAKLPATELAALLLPENKDKLVKLLTNHVVQGQALEPAQMKRSRGAVTAGGDTVKFSLVRGRLRVGEARVTGDYHASNGELIAVDQVLIPN